MPNSTTNTRQNRQPIDVTPLVRVLARLLIEQAAGEQASLAHSNRQEQNPAPCEH